VAAVLVAQRSAVGGDRNPGPFGIKVFGRTGRVSRPWPGSA